MAGSFGPGQIVLLLSLSLATQIHFISGLPRSGSTLLCALLRQNPRFAAAMSSPVASLVTSLHQKMCGGEFSVFFDDERRATMLRGVFESYYANTGVNQMVFDTNRSWTAKMPLLNALYPGSRVICCVRETGWIIDSVERMLARNPLQLSRMFNFRPGASVYTRVDLLMNSETGLIGLPWANLREAWFGAEAHRLIVVPYETLARAPRAVLQQLYRELGEPWFEHDLAHVSYDEPDYDAAIGMPGLHQVRPKVEYLSRRPVIPPDLFAKHAHAHFWAKPELNPHGVTVLTG
jgi:sulfotransferase